MKQRPAQSRTHITDKTKQPNARIAKDLIPRQLQRLSCKFKAGTGQLKKCQHYGQNLLRGRQSRKYRNIDADKPQRPHKTRRQRKGLQKQSDHRRHSKQTTTPEHLANAEAKLRSAANTERTFQIRQIKT